MAAEAVDDNSTLIEDDLLAKEPITNEKR